MRGHNRKRDGVAVRSRDGKRVVGTYVARLGDVGDAAAVVAGNVEVVDGTKRGIRGLRLEVETSVGLRRVLVTHRAVFVDEEEWIVRSRVRGGGVVIVGKTHKVLSRKEIVTRSNDVMVNVVLSQLRSGARRVVVRLNARLGRLSGSWRLGGRGANFLGLVAVVVACVVLVVGGGAHFFLTVRKLMLGQSIGGGGPSRQGLVQTTGRALALALLGAAAVAAHAADLEQVLL